MMRFFLDTEFMESGHLFPITLLSIGIVAEDGREFYAINREADWTLANDWVKENVIPHLRHANETTPKLAYIDIAHRVAEFVGSGKPEFWGYYADYDWVVFAQLFGKMIDLPKGWPMYCRDIKQWCDELGNPSLPAQESTEHDALADARWNKEAFEFLQRYACSTSRR
jgi:3' exoribonuclease, RNase T-like